MAIASNPVSPVSQGERIAALDVLRGFAVLGILIMNIASFSMPLATYSNPTVFGDLTGSNWWVYVFNHLFADQKLMTMFSMLFGAGIVLVTDRAKEKGVSPWGLHGRRMLWLALIGLVHAYFLWYGDILFTYALCGSVVYLMRNKKPRTMVIVAVVVFAMPTLLGLMSQQSLPYWPEDQVYEFARGWDPPPEQLQDEVAVYLGGWFEQMELRLPSAVMLQTIALFFFAGWKAAGLMLLGMALYRWEVLTGRASSKVYRTLVFVGFGICLPLIIFGLVKNLEADYAYDYTMFVGGIPNYWGSVGVALGYVGVLCLLLKTDLLQGLRRRLAAVGRMALTNYLMQTIICTTIFYGHGFGLFGGLDRTQQALVVLGIWILQLIVSPIWLARYRFGPFEWLWRSLTYGRPQPLRQAS